MEQIEQDVTAYQAGNERAFTPIYDGMIGLAKVLCRGKQASGVDFEDVLQEALVGLMTAARTWDPTRGVPFRSFARLHMRWAINKLFDKEVKYHDSRVLGADVAELAFAVSDISQGVQVIISALDDETDVRIVEGVMNGDTLDTIGNNIGMSKQAISLRAIAIRERVRA